MEDVAIAAMPRHKWPWLQVLLKHNVMIKIEAVLFLADVDDPHAVADKFKQQFPRNADMIAAQVRLLEAPVASRLDRVGHGLVANSLSPALKHMFDLTLT